MTNQSQELLTCTHDPHDPNHLLCTKKREGKLKTFVDVYRERHEAYYHARHAHRSIHIIGDAVLLVLIVSASIAGIGALISQYSSLQTGVTLAMYPIPASVQSGVPFDMTAQYTNTGSTDVSDAKMIFTLPPLFELKKADGKPQETNLLSYEIGDLKKGERRNITFTILPHGSLGDAVSVEANLFFEKNNRAHVLSAKRDITIQDSALVLTHRFPKRLIPGQTITSDIQLKNTASEPSPPLLVKIFFFSDVITLDKNDTSPYIAKLTSLTDEEDQDIQTNIAVKKGAEIGTAQLLLTVWSMVGREELLQYEEEIAFDIVSPLLAVSVEGPPDGPLQPGKTYTGTIRVKNTATSDAVHIRTGVRIASDFLDNASLVSSTGFVKQQSRQDVLLWTHNSSKALAGMPPQSEKTFDFRFALKPSINLERFDETHDFRVWLFPFASYQEADSDTRYEVTGTALGYDLASSLTADLDVRYFTDDGDQIGHGPLPPRVGKTTRFMAFFQPIAGIHSFSQIHTSLPLAAGVVATGVIPVGSEFTKIDRKKHEVRISIPSIHSQLGNTRKAPGVVFEIALTPDAKSIGTSPTLFKPGSINAHDDVVDVTLKAQTPHLTTRLMSDSRASGKFTVQP